MTEQQDRKRVQAQWRRLAQVIGPRQPPAPAEIRRRYYQAMGDQADRRREQGKP